MCQSWRKEFQTKYLLSSQNENYVTVAEFQTRLEESVAVREFGNTEGHKIRFPDRSLGEDVVITTA